MGLSCGDGRRHAGRIAPSPSLIHPALTHLAAAADDNRLAGTGVVAALAKVPDPQARRGVRHQISAILALAARAVLDNH
ncbi:MAG TPA: hypothetical protein VFO16_18085 [Pseudonocardiaceae bacterium]|nr:hypothetical protein [Pseudonocardiaceae bacterium]